MKKRINLSRSDAANKKREVEISEDIRKCALDIIGECAFGYQIDSQRGNKNKKKRNSPKIRRKDSFK